MARGRLAASVSLGSVPRWEAILLIFIGSRLVSSAIMLWFAGQQRENAWTDSKPDLFEFSRIWDSHWYRVIAEGNYPSELPLDDKGRVGENAWAFMPIFPTLIRALMALTGGSFAVLSVVVSALAFAGFLFAADRLFRKAIGERAALAAISVIAFAPVSPIFQVGYAESLGMLFLALVLIGFTERRWWLAAVFIPLAALTRPIGVPIAFMAFVLLLLEWKGGVDRAKRVWITLLAGISALTWPAIAWFVTGRMTAYLDTEFAWRRSYTGNKNRSFGTGWWDAAVWWFNDAAPWVIGGLCVAVLVIAFLPATRSLGRVMVSWTGSYFFYLLLVFFPQSSTFRILAPIFPLAGIVAKRRGATVTAILLGIVGQYFWVEWCWAVDDFDWTPP